jgi:hypothetical protein
MQDIREKQIQQLKIIKFVKTNELDECREKIAKMTERDTPSNDALFANKRTKKLLR